MSLIVEARGAANGSRQANSRTSSERTDIATLLFGLTDDTSYRRSLTIRRSCYGSRTRARLRAEPLHDQCVARRADGLASGTGAAATDRGRWRMLGLAQPVGVKTICGGAWTLEDLRKQLVGSTLPDLIENSHPSHSVTIRGAWPGAVASCVEIA